MNRHKSFGIWLLAIVAAVFVLVTFGCGGGSGSDSSQKESDGEGKVAVYLTDAPTDEFDHIWIELSEISLIPSGDGPHQVIFQTDDPEPIDLLALRDGVTQLLGVDQEVPAGEYAKIRLEVISIEGEKENQIIEFKLSSGRIDLNPQEEIIVVDGQTLSIQIDIDAEKSIQIAGPNYNFRPVVFVDAEPLSLPVTSCRMLSGEIEALIFDEAQPEAIVGFQLSLFHGIHTIDVMLQEQVVIFDDQGSAVGPEALSAGQSVQLTGELDSDGQFWADRIVIGTIDIMTGVVDGVIESNQFQLDTFNAAADAEESSISVALSTDTIILIDGIAAGPDQIQPGQEACVAGKLNEETMVLQAVAIFIKAPRINGKLTALDSVEGGSMLTISQGEQDTVVFLAEDVIPTIYGGDVLTVDDLAALIECEPPQVEVVVDHTPTTDEAVVQAIALDVLPEIIDVEVAHVDADTRVITTSEGQTIYVAEDAMLILHSGYQQEEYTLADLKAGDQLWVAALKTCDPVADYHAAAVIKASPSELPCMPHLEQLKITVDQVDGNTIMAADETMAVEVTEDTIYIDLTQEPPQEMTINDIEAGDTLICDVLKPCEDGEATQALIILKVNPEDSFDDIMDQCQPEAGLIDITVESVSEGTITTIEGEVIQVSEDTPIIVATEDGMEEIQLSGLKPGDQLEVFVVHSCEDESLTAAWIFSVAPGLGPVAEEVELQ